MKTSIKSIAAAVVLSAVVAAPAAAMVPQGELNRDIRSALGGDSTVTLSGYFADAGDKNRALQAAANGAGIERVINFAFQTN